MMKTMGSELKDLEERNHRGGKVKISEIVEVKMKLNMLEVLLQEQGRRSMVWMEVEKES